MEFWIHGAGYDNIIEITQIFIFFDLEYFYFHGLNLLVNSPKRTAIRSAMYFANNKNSLGVSVGIVYGLSFKSN